MTFEPIAPVAALITIAAILVGIRMAALYRVLVRTGMGRYLRVVLRWGALTVAGLLLVLASTRPGLPHDTHSRANMRPHANSSANANIFFVVDRSVDGRVDDFTDNKSRMSGIRSDIAALIDQYPRARFAVIAFASKARLDWPLSDDAWSLKPYVNGLSAYTDVPDDAMYQVNIGAANDLLRTKLDEASKQYKDSKNLVFYLGEGAGGSRVAQGSFDIGHGTIAGGAVLGYGSTPGGPIPMAFFNGNLTYMWDQQNNQAANSAINEDGLKSIAGEFGVPYFHRDNSPVTPVVPAVDLSGPGAGDAPVRGSMTVERTELYWVFTGLAAVLALTEVSLTLREFRRNRIPRRVGR
jgi:Ca-activated chloride channel family protein